MEKIKVIIQFEENVIPDSVITMPCVPAVGSWITFPKSWMDSLEVPVDCNEYRVTSVDYHIDIKGNVCDIYVSVCKNYMYRE